MRNKLIELIEEVIVEYVMPINLRARVFSAHIADHLIENGVTLATDINDGCKWIPVSEWLPSHEDDVLVCFSDGYVCGAYYDVITEEWIHEDGTPVNDRYTITHWMPLPEPPKENE